MKQIAVFNTVFAESTSQTRVYTYIFIFLVGLLAPLGFAPFHLPGLTLLSLALLYSAFLNATPKEAILFGFLYGMGYFGFGVSWVIISIHDYGQLNYLLAGIATLLFIMYLALYPALVGYIFKLVELNKNPLLSTASFCVLWVFCEWLRAHFLTGFPWLLVGTTQIDTPLKYLTPIVGVYGMSFLCVLGATLLAIAIREKSARRYFFLCTFILLIISPTLLKNINWTTVNKEPVTVGAVQANLSMRDKWDETLFWHLLKLYEQATDKLLSKQLIILPESAIPLPANYLNEYLLKLNAKAIKANSAMLLGILQPTDESEAHFFNSIITLGSGVGEHIKHQLVPFGEYIPRPFVAINKLLNLPEPNISPGKKIQPLIKILNHPIASLICYETAYPYLLRMQMPQAELIVSISDNGWFGKSLASYQQLQMSQVLSLLTGRYQVVVNNDGLSSVINTKGDIVDSLPPFSSGILESEVFLAQGTTPWIDWNEYPLFIFCALISFLVLISHLRHIRKQ